MLLSIKTVMFRDNNNMIMIDDAGSGSFVGGTCIGIFNTNSDEYTSFIIPVKYYSTKNFKKKAYINFCVETCLKELKKFNSKEIQLCRGYMFDKLSKQLINNGINVDRIKVEGTLQQKVEESFKEHVLSLGLFPEYIKYTAYPFHFHKLLRWVLACPEERVPLCKTGWKSWRKYKNVKGIEYTGEVTYSNIYCMKCGKKIPQGDKANIFEYKTNKTNYIYTHLKCKKNPPG